MESNEMQTNAMKPSEPQTRRVVVFYIWKKSRKKVKNQNHLCFEALINDSAKIEQQNKGDLEGRGTDERFKGRFVVDVQTADSLYGQ